MITGRTGGMTKRVWIIIHTIIAARHARRPGAIDTGIRRWQTPRFPHRPNVASPIHGFHLLVSSVGVVNLSSKISWLDEYPAGGKSEPFSV